MFLSPTLQRLLDVAEKDPAAAALSLLAGAVMHGDSGLPPFDAIAWDAEDACLSLRSGTAGGWRRLWLGHANVEAVTDHDATKAGGASPVALWVDHPDTATEIGLPVIGPFSVAFPMPTADYFAEDIGRKIREQAVDIAAETGVAGVLVIPEEVSFPSEVSGDPAALAREAEDVADASTTAQIMEPMTPMMLTVPAEEIPDLKPGHPVYDEAVRQSFLSGSGFIVVPEELTPLADEVAGLLANLPRRTRQQPSQIAQASSNGTCPICLHLLVGDEIGVHRACLTPQAPSDLADNECTCAYRGSGPFTYACPQHPRCLNDQHPEGHFVCQLGVDHEGWHADGSAKWEADWHMS